MCTCTPTNRLDLGALGKSFQKLNSFDVCLGTLSFWKTNYVQVSTLRKEGWKLDLI